MRMHDSNGLKMTVTPTKTVDLPMLAAVRQQRYQYVQQTSYTKFYYNFSDHTFIVQYNICNDQIQSS